MSIFNELLPKINEISKAYTKNFNDDLKVAFECLDKFEEEYQFGRGRAREKAQKDKNNVTTLQSINEDEGESNLTPENAKTNNTKRKSSIKSNADVISLHSLTESNENLQRASKKRSKNEVDGLFSPEQDKRQKRNASVRAQSIISKQINVNLTQKLRRENSTDKTQSARSRRRKDDDKENTEPPLNVQIKQEKISLPSEPMDSNGLPINIEVKQEPDKDELAMPPPLAPVPKPRKAMHKDKLDESDEDTGKRRTRTRKQTDTAPPPMPSARSTRSSCRAARPAEEPPTEVRQKRTRAKKKVSDAVNSDVEKEATQIAQENGFDTADEAPAPTETRPKRTRAKKKVSEVANNDAEKEIRQTPQENGTASPAEKSRPKRTRKAQKPAEKEAPQIHEEIPPTITPKEERFSNEVHSPILPQKEIKVIVNKLKTRGDIQPTMDKKLIQQSSEETDQVDNENNIVLDETKLIVNQNFNATVTLTSNMDKTIVLPNGVYNHAPNTPKNIQHMNETVVIDSCNRETMILDKPTNIIMDATVVIDKEPKVRNLTEDDSLITDDSDFQNAETPPKQDIPVQQPTSAVKEKVQQFEELASRVTRTKTRAMVKKEDQIDTQTPPDKIVKPVLSADTLSKMNSMIFNGKPLQVSSSATKLRANVVSSLKSCIPSSTSKLSGINKAREAAEEILKNDKEDARKKKEAMLEAKREQQKRKREEKMSAAAAARSAAERSRRVALEAAERDRMEKRAHADLGKIERLKEAERRRQEAARKAAETEERRRAEEAARRQRLAEEQRRALAACRRHQEEAEAVKKEAAIMAKEIERRQKEYIEKQKMKHRLEEKIHTPLKTPGTPGQPNYGMEPVYMADGFQYLNSDEDEDPVERPVPEWSTSKARKVKLHVQSQVPAVHIDRLFSVRVHSPDLRAIFPNIERARLKRTSSAVWRSPPAARLPPLRE